MYYIVYPLLYLVSLLPLRVLYLISDFAYWIIYKVKGYRKEVVMQNLAHAFPEKSEEERVQIAKEFYKLFTDTFIETIKLISMSNKQLDKRGKADVEHLNELIAKGKNIHILAGHQFNWEFANLLYARHLSIPFVGVYAPISNKAFEKIFYNTRRRNGTVMISNNDFTNKMHHVFTQQYILALAADQNPRKLARSFWVNFMGRPAPFVTGPGKGAVKNNVALVYVGFKRVKRGYYKFEAIPITENGADYTPEELTVMYKRTLENFIRENPSNYLWSHRRWRHEYKPEYGPILD